MFVTIHQIWQVCQYERGFVFFIFINLSAPEKFLLTLLWFFYPSQRNTGPLHRDGDPLGANSRWICNLNTEIINMLKK